MVKEGRNSETTPWESSIANNKKRNRLYVSKINKRCKQIVFQPDDWIWMHMRKEWFHNQIKSKL